MRTSLRKVLLFLCLFLAPITSHAKALVLTCETEWGSLAREIVKNKADISVAVVADQNPRNVTLDANLISLAKRAEIIFCSGGDLESSWLPTLMSRSDNPQSPSRENRLLLASQYSNKPGNIAAENAYLQSGSRVHLNPHNVTKIAEEFTKRIKLADPLYADFYQKSYEEFAAKWQKEIATWERKSEVFKGTRFVANDNSWTYLADWLGIEILTLDDPKTGAKPDPIKLHEIAAELKTKPVEAILMAKWENKDSLIKIGQMTKTRAIMMPFTTKGPMTLFKLFDTTINYLLIHCSNGVCKSLLEAEKMSVKFR